MQVLKRAGVSGSSVARVLKEFPRIMIINECELGKRIEFLFGVGIRRNKMDQICSSLPKLLAFGVDDRLKPLLNEFRSLGFTDNVIRKEINREPKILAMELGELSRCLELIRNLKCREAIKERIYSNGTFRAGFEVKLRVDCLCRHGLIRRDAFKVLWFEPRSITYEVDEIEKKIDFLVHEMKLNITSLIEVPEYLGVNFDKQIVPRYKVIEYLRLKGALGCNLGLKDLINPSRLQFYNLYVKPYPECEEMFGRFSGVALRSRHPVGMWKLFKPQKYSQSKEDVNNIKYFMEQLV